jgi:hypothetical protein
MTRSQQLVLLAIIVGALLVTGLLQASRLVDCPPGHVYAITRLRCVEPQV